MPKHYSGEFRAKIWDAFVACGNGAQVARELNINQSAVSHLVRERALELGLKPGEGGRFYGNDIRAQLGLPLLDTPGRKPAEKRTRAPRYAKVEQPLRTGRPIPQQLYVPPKVSKPKAHLRPAPPPEHFEDTDLASLCRWCEHPQAPVLEFTLLRGYADGAVKTAGTVKLCEGCWQKLTFKPLKTKPGRKRPLEVAS